MAKTKHLLNKIPAVIFFLAIALPVILRPLVAVTTEESVFFTVEKTERVVDSASDGGVRAKYLIFTRNETFEDTDELVYGKFNSSDIYGLLKPGRSYEAKVVGLREPLFSWYRNIISVKEISR